jgi:hypothetical protein
MKLRLLISILFIIATTATAMHKIEHIHGDHDANTCQVCIVDNHSVSADIVDVFKDVELFRFEQVAVTNLVYFIHTKTHSYQNRAPPLKS